MAEDGKLDGPITPNQYSSAEGDKNWLTYCSTKDKIIYATKDLGQFPIQSAQILTASG